MENLANFGLTTVSVPPDPPSSGTVLYVSDASVFPPVPFTATIWPSSGFPAIDNAEIVRVTGLIGNRLTVQRQQEASRLRNIISSDQIAVTVTKQTLDSLAAGDFIRFVSKAKWEDF